MLLPSYVLFMLLTIMQLKKNFKKIYSVIPKIFFFAIQPGSVPSALLCEAGHSKYVVICINMHQSFLCILDNLKKKGMVYVYTFFFSNTNEEMG